MRKILILIISIIFTSIGFSQEKPTRLTLQDAIDYALENNRNAINAERDIDMAIQQKWESTATGLPQLSAKVDYQNFLKQQVQLIPSEVFGGQPGEFAEITFGTKHSATAFATLNQ